MGPGDLREALQPLELKQSQELIVGRETFDDAGVYVLSPDLAIVQTVDFFAPIVDDPYDFGWIAAANALSDVYAMGGQPLTAMNIVAFPADTLPLRVLTDILRGGQDAVHSAGAVIVGGHTIIDQELKYGLSVTGRAHPSFLLTNAGARIGERLVLTKPLGNGILATAAKRGVAHPAHSSAMVRTMKELNGAASRAALALRSKCATDVTGFGLLGHAYHVARASNVSLRISVADVPLLPGTREALREGCSTAGGARNLAFLADSIGWGSASDEDKQVLTDPQTSGGLLVCVHEARLADYLSRVEGAVEIGEVITQGRFAIELR